MSLKGNVAVCDGVGLLLDTCGSLCLDDSQRACHLSTFFQGLGHSMDMTLNNKTATNRQQ